VTEKKKPERRYAWGELTQYGSLTSAEATYTLDEAMTAAEAASHGSGRYTSLIAVVERAEEDDDAKGWLAIFRAGKKFAPTLPLAEIRSHGGGLVPCSRCGAKDEALVVRGGKLVCEPCDRGENGSGICNVPCVRCACARVRHTRSGAWDSGCTVCGCASFVAPEPEGTQTAEVTA
jgi:hypothetical protein